jgi:hypothetical protein
VGVILVRKGGDAVLTTTNQDASGDPDAILPEGTHAMYFEVPACFLRAGDYSLHIAIHVPGRRMIDEVEDAVSFTVRDEQALSARLGGHSRQGAVEPVLTWHSDSEVSR